MKSGADLIAEAKARIRELSPRAAIDEQARGGHLVLLDVRDAQEVNLGKIPGALHISRGNLETKVDALIPREARVVIYCASGNRSALAAETMQQMGYSDVASMAGGIRGWIDAGGEVE
jgi:rhodanese-related sulfurtransferase